MKTFKQHVNTRHVYHVDVGADGAHPISGKPVWTLDHSRDGDPSHELAALEVSTDGASARLSAHQWHGVVGVTVTAGVEPRTTLRDRFEVQIIEAPTQPPELQFSQHRNRPI